MNKKMPITIKAAIIGACISGIFIIGANLIRRIPSRDIQQSATNENSNQVATMGDNSPVNIYNSKKRISQTMVDSPNSVQIHTEDISGGIRANNLNMNVRPHFRQLTESVKLQLVSILNQNQEKEINITSVLGDQESFAFASSIKKFLQFEGYKVEGVNQSVFSKPIKGQIINPEGEKIKIIIGAR